jgi:hypothetical protein
MDPTDPLLLAAAHDRQPLAAPVDAFELLAQLGSEVAGTLSVALESVNTLIATGQIDRAGLNALRESIEQARHIGVTGQQLARFARSAAPLVRKRLGLTELLREVLQQRGREAELRGIELRQALAPAEVTSDPKLLYSLLQSVLDWGFEHAVSGIELAIELRGWPASARLTCQFDHRAGADAPADAAVLDAEARDALDSLSWRLLDHTASALGLRVQRKDSANRTVLAIEFPDTVPAPTEGLLDLDLHVEVFDSSAQVADSRQLAGSHVLAVASRREVRGAVRDALRPMGLMLDFASSVEEAAAFCHGALPHAIVYEGALGGERFERLRREALAAAPNLAFVEVAEDSAGVEVVHQGGLQFVRVGRATLSNTLPMALSRELARLAGNGRR